MKKHYADNPELGKIDEQFAHYTRADDPIKLKKMYWTGDPSNDMGVDKKHCYNMGRLGAEREDLGHKVVGDSDKDMAFRKDYHKSFYGRVNDNVEKITRGIPLWYNRLSNRHEFNKAQKEKEKNN